ncbi:Retinoblastoma-related protein 1 [Castilleja foliolosa]|uniref:Retinoblastoma-related protein 1 n=1 Tax=Castilleja foliolosa TaxID=1961234 RepID=A0ABD3BAQ2_9LAMI
MKVEPPFKLDSLICKNDIRLDDNMLEQSTKLFDESKNLLIANISALGNDTLDEAENVLVCICAILGEKV